MSLLLAATAACSSRTPDAEARENVVQDYIAAVQAGDRQRLAELAGPRVDATADIDAKVRSLGNKRWQSVSISWRQEEFPTVATAEIAAMDDSGKTVKDVIALGKVEGTWFVALGAAPDAGQPASTETP